MTGVELATAYVSLVADTSGIGRQINSEFGRAITRADQAGRSMGNNLAAGLGKGMAALAGGAAVIGGLKQVVTLGNDVTNSLNTMQAVSRATAGQMQAVSARAKELGNDMSLPATSAADAAAAMTELAKGGFTVEQSMQAAKGTLQLAAAAQIDAATAATIQSQALQAFGKDASYAAQTADVLANASNASSAEITDIAQGLQQSGTVAHQFGLTMEDTATALALFANSGIQGSDAGTLLKTALLSLTDQGKPAQEAIKDLGLTVYDAQGNFVGLESLFGQLQDASKNMTPEMYQAATATLFGSDAARLAGVAAQQGATGFAAMETAIGRQGAAAEVAAAKTQGLPGALGAVQNSAETLALGLYDLIDGPLESLATNTADFMTDYGPGFIDTLGNIGSTIAGLPGPVNAFAGALLAAKVTGLSGWADSRITGGIETIKRSFSEGSISVSGAVNKIKGAGAGLVNFLGGPWAIGIAAAGTLLTANFASAASARQAQDTLTQSVTAGAKAQAAFSDAVSLANGALSDQAKNAGADVVKNALSEVTTLGERGHTSMETLGHTIDNVTGSVLGMNDEWENAYDKVSGAVEQNDALKSVMGELKIDLDDVGRIVTEGGPAYDNLISKLHGTGQAGSDVADKLKAAHESLNRAQEAAKNSTPGFATLQQAIKTLADESASAADKVDAMRTALDILSGKPVALTDAMQQYNKQVRDTAEATSAAWDQTQGWGAALIQQDGSINTASANGDKLYQSIKNIRDATITAAEAGATMGPVYAQNEQQFLDLANATGLTVEQVRNLAVQAGLVPQRIDMLAQLEGADTAEQQLIVIKGLLDTNAEGVDIPVDALDADARRKLEELGIKVEEVNNKPGVVHLDAPNKDALAKLQEIIDKQLPDKTVTIVANTNSWNAAMQQVLAPESKQVTVRYSDDSTALYGGGILPMPGVAPLPRAAGGPINGGVPGKDSVPVLAMPGEHMLTVDDVNAMGGQSGVYDFRRALHMAKGGAVTARDYAQSMVGTPYMMGGFGTGGIDCSGFVSAVVNAALGLDPYSSRMSTVTEGSWLTARGAKLGSGPGSIMIGWWDQGGGANGHTAGTFWDGTNFESNGSQGVVVGGRTGARDAQFTNRAYFPVGTIVLPGHPRPNVPGEPDAPYDGSGQVNVPGSSRGSTGTETVDPRITRGKDLADTISGRFGDAAASFVSGQVQDILGVFGFPDQLPALKAASEFQKATDDYAAYQKSVVDYEQQQTDQAMKAGESSTTTPPATPPTTGENTTGDTGIIYDPAKGAAQWKPLVDQALGLVGSSLANSQRSVEQVDIESSGNPEAVGPDSPDGKPMSLLQVKPGTFAAYKSSELPDSITNPLSNLYAGMNYAIDRYEALEKIWPTRKGYDTGGWLSPGLTLLDNQTGRNEVAAVFNPEQWDNLATLADGRGGGDTHNWNITGSNADEIVRKVQSIWRRSQSRHTGRAFQNA